MVQILKSVAGDSFVFLELLTLYLFSLNQKKTKDSKGSILRDLYITIRQAFIKMCICIF